MWEDNEQMEMEQKGLEGSEAKVVNGKRLRERSERRERRNEMR